MSDNKILLLALVGVGVYLITRKPKTVPAQMTSAAESGANTGYLNPTSSGNATIADMLGGLGAAAGQLGKALSSNNGAGSTSVASIGSQRPGSALWSVDYDRRLDSVATLDDPTSDGWDTGYSSWEKGADYNAASDSYSVPSYTDNLSLGGSSGDYTLDAPSYSDIFGSN